MPEARTSKGKQRHDQILKGCAQALVDGSAMPTVVEICERAGVGRPSFYYYFETVPDVVGELAAQLSTEFAAHMEAEFGTERGLQRFVACVSNLLQRAAADPAWGRVVGRLPDISEPLQATFRKEGAKDVRAALRAGDLSLRGSEVEPFIDLALGVLVRALPVATEPAEISAARRSLGLLLRSSGASSVALRGLGS